MFGGGGSPSQNINERKRLETFGKHWGWAQIIYTLAENLSQPLDYPESLNVVEAFNYYAYIVDKQELQNAKD